jgi:uncharacterized membrane-anchored protein
MNTKPRMAPPKSGPETTDRQSAAAFEAHPDRAAALGEIHARPFPSIPTNRVVLHYAFAASDRPPESHSVLADLCRARGESAPDAHARYHVLDWGKGKIRWERHSEFTTFWWDGVAPRRFLEPVANQPFGANFTAPGQLISACRIEIRPLNERNLSLIGHFDGESLAVTRIGDCGSVVATDLRQDGDGLTIFLLLENRLNPERIGYLVKTLTDLETYRTLAMLGLQLAQSLSSRLSGIEAELARLTGDMRHVQKDQVHALLDEITKLASNLEADAAASLFRFGATRAYGEIVRERIAALKGTAMDGHMDIGEFLERRLAPALRNCLSVEERQANLSRKLARTANLLRTRIDVEIEHQNRDLLQSMNRRARQQLRLQQTVEGLSVAAISYYIVGLFLYLAGSLEVLLPFQFNPKVAAGLFVPLAVAFVWWTIRRLRSGNLD